LAVHLLPRVLETFKGSDRAFEVTELPSLFAAIDDHLRHQTDLVVYTLRKSKLRRKPAMPRLEGLKPENLSDFTEFRLRDTVWVPRLPQYGKLLTTKDDYCVTPSDLGNYPVVLVGFPDAAEKLSGPNVKKVRVIVDTNEAMRRMVQHGFVGVGHNWPPLPEETAVSRRFEWRRPDIDICLCYRVPKKHSDAVTEFIRELIDRMSKEAKALAAS
jgi:DNA-binding transcriptional LysR family regulator